jgi:DNA polymerase
MRTGDYEYEGIPVIATYHPAALLRNPNFKKPCWEDMQKLRDLINAV